MARNRRDLHQLWIAVIGVASPKSNACSDFRTLLVHHVGLISLLWKNGFRAAPLALHLIQAARQWGVVEIREPVAPWDGID